MTVENNPETGMSTLERNIERFQSLLAEMKEATREAHSALKQIKIAQKEQREYLATEGKKLIEQRVDEVVKTELDRIGPEVKAQSSLIYDKVGHQIDRLIDLSLGKKVRTDEDLRPMLAERLREWLREIIMEEGMLSIIDLKKSDDGSEPN